MNSTILIVASDKSTSTAYAGLFNKKEYTILTASSGRQALVQAKAHDLDAVVLDTSSPKLNSKSLCRKLRSESSAPLILITPPNSKLDGGMATGAILHTPIVARKLLARVRSAIDEKPPRTLTVGNLSLDLAKRRLLRGSKVVRLRPKEFLLLKLLMSKAGQTITRKTLMKEVWETDYLGDTRTLDVHIRWVREKVEDNPSKPKRLVTIRRQGYKFVAEA